MNYKDKERPGGIHHHTLSWNRIKPSAVGTMSSATPAPSAATRRKATYLFLLLLPFILLVGCGQKQTGLPGNTENFLTQEDSEQVQDSTAAEDKAIPVLQEPPAVKEEMPELEEEAAIDYDFLTSKGYEFLEEDITTVAGNVREHPLLKEYLREEIEFDEDFCERFGSRPSIMEYFLYDMNQDGVDDYIVCYDGVPYVGSAGNLLSIYIQEEDSLRMVFSANVEIHLMEGGHAPIAILNDSEEGYYSFVLPYTNNRVWKYDNGGYYSE